MNNNLLQMNENEFISKRAGKLIWEPNGAYYRFEANYLPLKFTENPELSAQAQKTIAALSKLEGLTIGHTKKEIILFQTPFMIKEAQLSSEIEGTRSTISDVLKEEKIEELDPERKLDNEEIRNYKKALIWAIEEMPKEFTEEFIKNIHKKLLEGVRGYEKEPGEYKKFQNGIGRREDTLDSAKFIPASPESTPKLMGNLIKYANKDALSNLYKIAIIHYQLEAIHPFRDGNGRLGRMFIVLELVKDKILTHPLLYISEYFTKNRETYIDLMYDVSSKGKIEEWIKFFLEALENQANKSLELLIKIKNYKQELYIKADILSNNSKIYKLINFLFEHPFINVKDIQDILKVSQPTAWKLTNKLIEHRIIKEVNTKSKKKIYVAYRVIDILEGRE